MCFEDAVFTVIVENVSNHRKRQACMNGVMNCVREWGAAGQLPVAAQPQQSKVGQKTPSNLGSPPCGTCANKRSNGMCLGDCRWKVMDNYTRRARA